MKHVEIMPYLQDPLVLIGFALFLFFGMGRFLLRSGIIPPLPTGSAYSVIRLLLTYGFILALAVVGVGFLIKYRQMSESEQEAAVQLLEQELNGNLGVVSELQRNIETILRNTSAVHEVLRHPGIRLTAVFFPSENTDPKATVPPSLEFARRQMLVAKKQGLFDNPQELWRFREAGKAIVGTIDRTKPTIVSFADTKRIRYRISTEVWKAHLPILRQIQVVDVRKLQSLYQDMERLRVNYTVTLEYCVEYLDVVRDFFANRNQPYTPQRLATVLAAERIFMTTIVDYAKKVVEKLEQIIKTRQELMDLAHAS